MHEKKKVAVGLGAIALAVDVITIISFIDNSKFVFSDYYLSSEFWTFSWVISIVLITLLYSIGVGLLTYAYERPPSMPVLAMGGAYVLGSLIIYLRLGYLQLHGDLDFQAFAAIAVLFVVCAAIGIISIGLVGDVFLRYPGYAYGAANIVFVFMLINKYVFNSSPFSWGFLGEALVLVAGGALFVGLFFADEL